MTPDQTGSQEQASSPAQFSLLLEPLLGIHSAPTQGWLADAADTAAQRGLGALYALLYLQDASGQLAGERPASSERMRALARVHQALDTDLTALKFSPLDLSAVAAALEEGRVRTVPNLSEALPLNKDAEQLSVPQRMLGIAECWLVPLLWNGEGLGLLLLLMPSEPAATVAEAELLGRHVAVALISLRQKDSGRKHGELDAVRWVFDEERFLDELCHEVSRARRHERPLSIMVVCVHNLDELRLRYGRFLAEQVLRQFGSQLTDGIRDTDFLGAFREDGFATILVEADEQGAQRAKHRLLAHVQTIRQPELNLPNLHLELSCATATLPQDGKTAEELADAAARRLVREAAA